MATSSGRRCTLYVLDGSGRPQTDADGQPATVVVDRSQLPPEQQESDERVLALQKMAGFDDQYVLVPFAGHNISMLCESGLMGSAATSPLKDLTNSSEPTEHSDGIIWRQQHTNMLIQLVQQYDDKFQSSMRKQVWMKIAKQLTDAGFPVSWEQVDNKWKRLKKRYKSVKDHNSTSGNSRKEWQYLEAMDAAIGNKPDVTAPVVINSRTGIRINTTPTATDNTADDGNGDSATASLTTPRKRKRPQSDKESPASKRHRESMDFRKQAHTDFMDLMTKLIDKL